MIKHRDPNFGIKMEHFPYLTCPEPSDDIILNLVMKMDRQIYLNLIETVGKEKLNKVILSKAGSDLFEDLNKFTEPKIKTSDTNPGSRVCCDVIRHI